MSDFSTVAVLWYRDDAATERLARDVVAFLATSGRKCVEAPLTHDDDAADAVAARRVATGGCQLAVVLGGDGSLLAAARALADLELPLLGVNLGRLGFLVDLSPTETLAGLGAILDGRHRLEERLVIEATVLRDGSALARGMALNEVALHKWNSLRAIELQTRIAGRLLYSQRADGLIVSTPTGSTAYALSAGGPIVYPDLRALLVVPVCQHMLGIRPVVVGAEVITVTLTDTRHAHARAVWDGQRSTTLAAGDVLEVRPRPRPLKLLHPETYDYFELLRSKLHWGR